MKIIAAVLFASFLASCVDGRTGEIFGPPPGLYDCVYNNKGCH